MNLAKKLSLVAILLLSTNLTFAKGMSVDAPYVREVPPGQMTSASFLTIKNASDKDVSLIKASSDVAKNVELHEHVHDNGMMKMRQVKEIKIPANGKTVLKPGGYHIMLIGLTRKIKAGDMIDIELEFNNGDKQAIKAEVKKIMQGMMGNMKGMKMGGMKQGKMDKKAMNQHLNPMPNLMLVFKKMPEKLNLNSEQAEKLKKGVAKRNPKVKTLFKKVMQLEAELNAAALNDKPLSTIDQLANSLMQERENIIKGKALCADSVKSILDEKQFATMREIYKTKMSSKPNFSNDMQGKIKMKMHVNPMPNLMMVVKKMSDKLNLNKQQAADLKQWQEERGPVMKKQYATVIKLESELQDAALSDATPEKISGLSDAIMQERIKIIRGKAFCRDNMKRILDNAQYNKVIELYKTKMM